MVKEEEIMAEAGGRGYMDMLGLGEEAMADYFLCPSPSSSYLSSAAVSTTTNASTHAAAASPTCASYRPPPAGPYRHILSFGGRAEQQYPGAGGDMFGALQYYYGSGGGHAVPVAVPRKSSPTTECSSSISSMSSSPTATAVSAPKPQPPKKKGSRSSDQRKAAAPAAATANKRPRVRRERLGERILALQQLVSPFGKTDTASVLHEALGYIRFLHDQVQEQPRAPTDLRSRGLCLVPVACTDHVAGGRGNGADVWSTVAAMGLPADQEQEEDKAAMLRGDRHPGQLA
ncbi:hypothetical protein ACQ4PT_067978 [Festuca glaucescens]